MYYCINTQHTIWRRRKKQVGWGPSFCIWSEYSYVYLYCCIFVGTIFRWPENWLSGWLAGCHRGFLTTPFTLCLLLGFRKAHLWKIIYILQKCRLFLKNVVTLEPGCGYGFSSFSECGSGSLKMRIRIQLKIIIF